MGSLEALHLVTRHILPMSFDGPCTVLRGGMHGFPFNNNDGRISRGQLHPQRHVRQHQPGGAFGLGLAATRRASTDRKENTEALHADAISDNLSSAFTSGSGAGGGWDVGDDSLPPLIDTPRLRSVSSLVLSSDGEELHLPADASTDYAKGRGTRELSSGWGHLLEGFTTAIHSLPSTPTPLGLPSMPSGISNQRLQREPSFPPPNLPTGSPRPISREASFPLPHDSGMVLESQELVPDSVSQWRTSSNLGGRDSDVLGSSEATASPSDGKAVGIGGDTQDDHQFHRFNDGDGHEDHDDLLSKNEWDDVNEAADVSGYVDGEGVGGEGLYSVPPSEPDRKPSFDQLALLIPGVPQRFNSSRPGAEEKPHSSEMAKSTAVPRGRPASRQDPARRRSKGDDGTRARSGRHRGGGKIEDAPGSAGPPSRNGGPVDLAKKARREAAIKRYMYKRSRRKFANSTREASPSRSRPKAARIRPRRFGKFIKTVPDFIPVTEVVPDNSGEGDPKASVAAGVGQSLGSGGDRRRRDRVGDGGRDKSGFMAPINAASLDRSTFPQLASSRVSPSNVSTSSVLDGYSPLWPTP